MKNIIFFTMLTFTSCNFYENNRDDVNKVIDIAQDLTNDLIDSLQGQN